MAFKTLLGAIIVALTLTTGAHAQVTPPAMEPAKPAPVATTVTPAEGMSADEAAKLDARYPNGMYVPAADMDGRSPPRFFKASQLVTGVNVGGRVIKYKVDELPALANDGVGACQMADMLNARLNSHATQLAENEKRRAERVQNAQEREDNGNGTGKRVGLGVLATGLGYAAGGPYYAGIVGIGQVIGHIDHKENLEDRATFHESVGSFNDQLDYLVEVQTTDLIMRKGWIYDMSEVWCPAMRQHIELYAPESGLTE